MRIARIMRNAADGGVAAIRSDTPRARGGLHENTPLKSLGSVDFMPFSHSTALCVVGVIVRKNLRSDNFFSRSAAFALNVWRTQRKVVAHPPHRPSVTEDEVDQHDYPPNDWACAARMF